MPTGWRCWLTTGSSRPAPMINYWRPNRATAGSSSGRWTMTWRMTRPRRTVGRLFPSPRAVLPVTLLISTLLISTEDNDERDHPDRRHCRNVGDRCDVGLGRDLGLRPHAAVGGRQHAVAGPGRTAPPAQRQPWPA